MPDQIVDASDAGQKPSCHSVEGHPWGQRNDHVILKLEHMAILKEEDPFVVPEAICSLSKAGIG
jgi:hypothetical protein